jgi:hypothetical protein
VVPWVWPLLLRTAGFEASLAGLLVMPGMVDAPVPVTAVDDEFELPASLMPPVPDEPVVLVPLPPAGAEPLVSVAPVPLVPAVLPAVPVVLPEVPEVPVAPVVVAGVVMVVSAEGAAGSFFLQPPSRAATATTLINNFDGVNAVFMMTPFRVFGRPERPRSSHNCFG